MATNQIRDVTFRLVTPVAGGDSDGGHALFITLDLADLSRLHGFLEEIVTRFKHERLAGPPDARFLLITVAGDLSASDFAQDFQAAIANDAAARALLGTLRQADVMHTDAHGHVIDQASLLAS